MSRLGEAPSARLPLLDEGTRVAATMTTRGSENGLDDEQLVALYRCAKTVRLTDERAAALAGTGAIGFQAPTGGHEAAVLGAAAALRERDWLFAGARDHAAALWRGLPLRRYWDHLYANADDVVKGRPMPDHFSYRQARVASVTAPLGSQLSHAVGLAWAARSQGADEVVLVMFGEGDVSSSDFHNALNFAGVWRAPVVFFCRTDAEEGGQPSPPAPLVDSVADRGVAYGVAGVRCDGGDVLAVHAAVGAAIRRATAGEGAMLVEAAVPEGDPLATMRALVAERVGWSDAQETELDDELGERVSTAVAAAEKAPRPPLSSMFEDIYAQPPWHLREQRDELGSSPRAPQRSFGPRGSR